MSLTPAFLDELRARTVLSTLVGKTTKLTKAGREYKGCCPFHQEKTPSFYVNDDKGFYHCFGCSAHGDAIRWLTDQRGLPFMDAVKELAAAAGMDVPAPDPRAAERQERARGLNEAMEDAQRWFESQLAGLDGTQARALIERRGLKPETVRAFGLGFAPDSKTRLKTELKSYGDPLLVEAGLLISVEDKAPYDRFRGRLMIPIRDPRGRVIAFGGRVIGDGEPKYLNSPDTPLFDKGRTLYNLDRALPAARKAGRVIVVEGYMDVIALAQAGIGEAVAPLGTALTEAQLERLWRIADVPVLCFDGDAAGQKAALRAAQRALPLIKGDQSLQFVTLPDGKDPDDIIRERGPEAFNAVLAKAQPLVELLWRAELAAKPLQTPEQRAGLGKRLRMHANTVQDGDIKTYYLAEFAERAWNLFHPDRPSKSYRSFGFNAQRLPISERLKAISEYGIDQVTIIPGFIQGLINFPDMIAPLAEAFGRIPINAIKLRQVRERLLDAALMNAHRNSPLETAEVLTILREDALGAVTDKLKDVTLAFSFLAHKADADQARSDLALVAEKLDVGPAIESELSEAQERYQAHWDDAYFEDYVRLMRAKQRMEQIFMDALLPDEAPVE